MNSAHQWFHSGPYSVLAHVDVPRNGIGLGAVIVPPFGWEDVCCYRSLRRLGQLLAESGVATLRFDLPGTGDSSGSAFDSGLVDCWIDCVGRAAAELRAASGVKDVGVVGIRLGALLALAAAKRGADVQQFALWGPAPNGRNIVRELIAFRNIELRECADGEVVPNPPRSGLDVAGFLISHETQRALEEIDVRVLPDMVSHRALLLSRDQVPPDAAVVRALEDSGCYVQIESGTGYAAMLAPPHQAVSPAQTFVNIVDFLTSGARGPENGGLKTGNAGLRPPRTNRLLTTIENTDSCETVYPLENASGSIFSIISEPAPHLSSKDMCLIFLNSGAVRHIGPNRMWVEAARRWACRGIPSLRMDFLGIGESDGEVDPHLESLYERDACDQIGQAMDSLRSRIGVHNFAVLGLCSGAFWGFHGAMRYPEIRGAILMNPRLFFWDPEVDRRRALRSVVSGISDATAWGRLVQGKVNTQRLKQAARAAFDNLREPRNRHDQQRQIPPDLIARAWETIKANDCRVTLVFTEGEPLLMEMEDEGQLPSPDDVNVRCIRVTGGGHTFRPLWAQRLIHDIIDNELEMFLQHRLATKNEIGARPPP